MSTLTYQAATNERRSELQSHLWFWSNMGSIQRSIARGTLVSSDMSSFTVGNLQSVRPAKR